MAATGEAGVTMTFAEQVETVELLLDAGEFVPEWLDDAYDAHENGITIAYVGGERILVSDTSTYNPFLVDEPECEHPWCRANHETGCLAWRPVYGLGCGADGWCAHDEREPHAPFGQLAGWPVGVTLNGIYIYADIDRAGKFAAFATVSGYDMNGEVAW